MRSSHSGSAIPTIIVAALLFSLMDASTKYLGALLPATIILWIRYTIQTLVMGAAVWRLYRADGFRSRHPRMQFLRGAMLVLLSVLSFHSLKHMPLAEFTAIVMLSPVLVTVFSSRMSRLPLGPARWALLFGGFAGTLVVIRPGGALFGIHAVLPLLTMLAATAYNLLTSHLAVREYAHTTQFYTGLVGICLTAPLVALRLDELPGLFGALAPRELLVLLAIGLLGTVGHLLLVTAFRLAPAASLMPFTYTQILFAAAAGWVQYRHVPDAWAWSGMALIAACSCSSAWLDMRKRSASRSLN